MNMYAWALVIFSVSLTVLLVAAALLDPGPAPARVRVYRVPPRWPAEPLRPFPGEGVVTHNELDQFARHYQGLTR